MKTLSKPKDCAPETTKGLRPKCGSSGRARVRFYRGMLLDERDLTAEQQYQDELRRKLALAMHGCGILCGLELKLEEICKQPALLVTPGMAIDGTGRVIEVRESVTLRMRDLCRQGETDCCHGKEPRAPLDGEYDVVLHYDEHEADRRAVHLSEEGACGAMSEPARVQEGWCLELRPVEDGDEDPDRGSIDVREWWALLEEICEPSPRPCPEECCRIVLGRVVIDCECEKLDLVPSTPRLRRYAWTARRLDLFHQLLCAWRSTSAKGTPTPAGGQPTARPETGKPGK